MTLTNILRWIHILAGAAWLGEVVVVNFVLVPAVARLVPDQRGWFLAAIFPRVFRLASVLSLTTVVAGAALNLSLSGWQLDVAVARLTASRWGWNIVIGGLLGLGLTLFHHTAERRLEPFVVAAHARSDSDAFAILLPRLRLIPRAGLAVLVLIFLLMMFAARGF